MKRLYLLRHAKSGWDDPVMADHDRPLAPRGQRASAHMAEPIRRLAPPPSLILCSTATRATQTLDLVRAALPPDSPIRIEVDLYTFDADVLRHRLAQVDDRHTAVLVIGHNPALELLAGALMHGDSGEAARRLRRKYPTAALVELDLPLERWSRLADADGRHPGGRVTRFTRPADLDEAD